MLLLLQLLGVFVCAGLGLAFLLVVIFPPLMGLVHGRHFTIVWWHPVVAGVFLALALWQAIIFGFIRGLS